MSRVQLALNVDDLDQAVRFYSTLFNTDPAKRKPGYANFAIDEPPLELVLIENPGHGGSVNHLGVEVGASDQVHAEIARLSRAGLFTEEQIATTCCFATQDKVWVTAPDSERWEVYTVLADSETFGTAPELALAEARDAGNAGPAPCCGTAVGGAAEGVSGGSAGDAAAGCGCCGTGEGVAVECACGGSAGDGVGEYACGGPGGDAVECACGRDAAVECVCGGTVAGAVAGCACCGAEAKTEAVASGANCCGRW